ncbi:MAG: 50S ribosomal protein L29 [Candidatus Woesearchaeota archaeon]
MKLKEIHSLKKNELENKLSELNKEKMKLSAQVAVGTTPKSPKQLNVIKKTIARIKTELSGRKD